MKSIRFETKNLQTNAITRPSLVKPEIESEFITDGVRYYSTTCGRLFDADTYDRNFKVDRKNIKKKGYKGENVCKRIAAVA